MNFVDWFVIGFFCAWFVGGSLMCLVIELKPYFRPWLVRQMKKSTRLMNWLNEPEKPKKRGVCNVLHR